MKPPNGNPTNKERKELRDFLIASGMSVGDASRLTALGQTRKQLADGLIRHLKGSKKAKK